MTDLGCLIAGGRARRLGGRAKGLLDYRGQPIIERTLDLLRARCAAVVIIGRHDHPYRHLGLPTHPDRVDAGPPGGVFTALRIAVELGHQWVWTVACDLPLLDDATLDRLIEQRADHDVALYRADGRLQPLAACWNTSALPVFTAALAAGRPGFSPLVARLNAQIVETPDPTALVNINTPADCAALGIALD